MDDDPEQDDPSDPSDWQARGDVVTTNPQKEKPPLREKGPKTYDQVKYVQDDLSRVKQKHDWIICRGNYK